MKKYLIPLLSLVCLSPLAFVSCASMPEGKAMSSKERAQLFIEIAAASYKEGDTSGALQTLDNAEKLEPEMPEVFHARALVFHARNEISKAIENAKKAVLLKPDYSDANNTLGKLLVDAGRVKEGEKYLLLATGDPLYRDAYKPLTNLGMAYYRQGQYDKARGYFDRAIIISPQLSCIAYYYRGHISLRESKTREAVRDYEKASKRMCGGFAEAHLALGIAYQRGKQTDLARKTFLDLQNKFPNTAFADQAVEQLKTIQ